MTLRVYIFTIKTNTLGLQSLEKIEARFNAKVLSHLQGKQTLKSSKL